MTTRKFAGIADLRSPHVNLSGAQISLEILRELCEALLRVDAVTKLDLSYNNLGDAGAEIVSEMLREKPQILHLNLRHNGIGDLGTSLLCRALVRHSTLRALFLGSNPVSDVGLTEVGKMIVQSRDIVEVDLIDTPISLQGTLAFADSLVRNESLTALRLPHVLGHRVLREVDRLLRRNHIRRNRIDERRALWDAQHAQETQHDSRLEKKWEARQPKAHKPPPASGFSVEEWSDPDLVPTLLYLEILDRKTKAKRQKALAEAADHSARQKAEQRAGLRSIANRPDRLTAAPSSTAVPRLPPISSARRMA